MEDRGRVGPVARALGYAGLLPQVAAVASIAAGEQDAFVIAATYPLLIFSFLGGIWWGFAMRRTNEQAGLAALSVLPSLVSLLLAFGFIAVAIGDPANLPWWFVMTGSIIVASLLVDRYLVRTGEAPDGWMALRIPLSVGLGGLTIAAGVLTGA